MTSQAGPSVVSQLKVRDGLLVVAGGAALLLALAELVLLEGPPSGDPATDLGGRLVVAWAIAVIGLASTSVGLVRLASSLPRAQRPSFMLRVGFVAFGVVGILSATGPLDWPKLYLATDPRSQPSHVLAAVLFFGFAPTVFFVVGSVLLVSGVLDRARSRLHQVTLADTD